MPLVPRPASLATALALAVAAVGGGCVEEQTPGDDLFGAWRQVDVRGGIGQEWVFHDDLTYDRSGAITARGLFHVDGRRLVLEPLPGSGDTSGLAFDYVSTRDHWLGDAQFAVGAVRGRIGTWRGGAEDLTTGVARDVTTTIREDGTVHVVRQVTGPTIDERWEGDGTWTTATNGLSITLDVTLIGPFGEPSVETSSLWRLDDALGGPLYERVAF